MYFLRFNEFRLIKRTLTSIFILVVGLMFCSCENITNEFSKAEVTTPNTTVPEKTKETLPVYENEGKETETVAEKITYPICGTVKLETRFDWLNVRSGPSTSFPRIGKLAPNTIITIKGEQNNFYFIDYLNMEAFVSKDYITFNEDIEPYSTMLYAHAPSEFVMSTDENKKEAELKDTLVDIKAIDDTIQTNVIFATDKNFTGSVLYPLDICMIQKDTALKLKKAQELFQKDGYSILIYDAYRPYSVSVALYEIIKNPIYIADPVGNPSRHNRGSAVDMTLVDSTGNELVMPSLMHTFDSTSGRNNSNMSEEARKNMDYMTGIMLQCGFVKYDYEWWHFNDEDCYDYPVTDHIYTDFIFSNESDWKYPQ